MNDNELLFTENVMAKLKPWISISVAFICTGLFIRGYEYIAVTENYILPDYAPGLYTAGIFYDLFFYSFLAVLVLPLYLALIYINRKAGYWSVIVLLNLFLIGYLLLVQYFAEVLVPLGADFFAYNFTEISDTVQTSINITFSRIFPLILFPAIFISLTLVFKKINITESLNMITGSGLLVLSLGFFVITPSEGEYEREIDYSLSANKAKIFSAAFLKFSSSSISDQYEGNEYPLLRPADQADVLGPYFNRSDRRPNIVFIIVESFGGTVMAPHANYGGFTPYLDSLAAQSLYWTHFLSTSGRSFNAQPSILASLPYGEQGFMEMGYLAPSHHSLISILNDNGYQTSYFGGYESQFDKLDQFLERQQVDLLMDASRFTDDYSKMDEIEGGFTWGYSDKDTYRRAFDFIDEYDQQSPRLDIFFTLNFHEPFIIQNTEEYQRKFRDRLNAINPEPSKREEYEQYENIFRALLYTDDAIRELMNRYRQREDFDDTIFVITGDHRMIPIPHGNRIDRYYVPFLIYSPLLKDTAVFEGVSSHLDVTPTILGYLEQNYPITQPDSVHWLGDMLSTSHEFTSNRRVPLMRNKNQMPDYLSGKYYLSGNQLFELERGMRLRRIDDPDIFERVNSEFNKIKRINRYVTSNDKIIRTSDEDQEEREQLLEEENYFTDRQLKGLNVVELFSRARELAFTGQYEDARLILRRVLRERPNYHDARLLLGRTYGWDGMYDLAESEFNEVIRRNPEVADAYSAKADLYFWQDEPDETIEIVNEGLSNIGTTAELLFRRARAYWQMGDQNKASELVEEGLNLYPENQNLLELKERL